MRISDWSSDVCSSDLSILMAPVSCSMAPSRSEDVNQETTARLYHVREVIDGDTFYLEDGEKVRLIGIDAPETPHSYKQRNFYYGVEAREYLKKRIERSEEHTSELQSLMRISYAVFCLKKKLNY